jgi:hypothetical protein
MIAEAGHPERVEPLDADGFSKRDRAMLDLLRDNGGTEIRVFIGDKELKDFVRTEIRKNENETTRLLVGGSRW